MSPRLSFASASTDSPASVEYLRGTVRAPGSVTDQVLYASKVRDPLSLVLSFLSLCWHLKMAIQQLESRYYTTKSGKSLHYQEAGSSLGPLTLCLHGLGGSTETFVPLVPLLPENRRIVLLDFLGFGKTPFNDSTGKVSVASHVADVSELITSLHGAPDAASARDTIIIGHSLGVIVALHWAAEHPESTGGLALLGVGRAAGHIPAVRQRMCDLAATVRSKGITYAADVAMGSNFGEET